MTAFPPKVRPRFGRIDKSVLAIGTLRRVRSPAHLDWIRRQPCTVPGCREQPAQAHHLTCGPDPKGRGLKAGDDKALPLCAPHHHDLHTGGAAEADWWAERGIDPIDTAAWMWARSPHGEGGGDDW